MPSSYSHCLANNKRINETSRGYHRYQEFAIATSRAIVMLQLKHLKAGMSLSLFSPKLLGHRCSYASQQSGSSLLPCGCASLFCWSSALPNGPAAAFPARLPANLAPQVKMCQDSRCIATSLTNFGTVKAEHIWELITMSNSWLPENNTKPSCRSLPLYKEADIACIAALQMLLLTLAYVASASV